MPAYTDDGAETRSLARAYLGRAGRLADDELTAMQQKTSSTLNA